MRRFETASFCYLLLFVDCIHAIGFFVLSPLIRQTSQPLIFRTVYFYNSMPQTRITVVTFPITSAHVVVKDAEGKVEISQIDPIWEVNQALSTNNFKVHLWLPFKGKFFVNIINL